MTDQTDGEGESRASGGERPDGAVAGAERPGATSGSSAGTRPGWSSDCVGPSGVLSSDTGPTVLLRASVDSGASAAAGPTE